MMSSNIVLIADKLVEIYKEHKCILTAGNGGSSSTASHFTNDLIKGCAIHGRSGIRSICLTDSSTLLTCLANDFSYDDALVQYIKTLGGQGDCLVLFSGSGNSQNIVNVAKYAKDTGIFVIGFLGMGGGNLKQYCDIFVMADSFDMEEIENIHLQYVHDIKKIIRDKLQDSFGMEIIKKPKNTKIKYAIFDFDGTISLIRQGWQDVMIPYFVEVLKDTPEGRQMEDNTIYNIVKEFVDRLTGKKTLFQCMALADWVENFGGQACNPIEYKNEYLNRLLRKINCRRQALELGEKIERYIIKGTLEFLKELKDAGIKLYCASGTDDEDVKYEVKLLGLDTYFGNNVFGARDDFGLADTKELVINNIINKHGMIGNELVVFGDGIVEIELCKKTGGYAVAVASDEVNIGKIDEWKRGRLIKAGADLVIPFYDADSLCKYMFSEE